MDSISVGGVERQSYHGLLCGQVYLYDSVVISYVAGLQFLEVLGAAVYVVVVLDLIVRNPDGAEASGLGSHDVDAIAEVNGKVLHAGAGELKHLVLHETALEYGLDQRDSHVMRTYALAGSAFQPYKDDLGSIDIPGIGEELLDKLAATFTHTHCAERAIACM